MRKIYRAVFLGGLVCLAMSTPAYAYLDPGMGSLILQAVIGALAAGLAGIGFYWRRLISFFRGEKLSEPDNDGKHAKGK